jgi:Fic family protein
MRITLTADEVLQLIAITSTHPELQNTLKNQFEADKSKDKSKKVISITKARNGRVRAIKERINNAMNLLRIEDKPLTVYQIAKISGCSYNTVKKHIQGGTDGR